MPSHTDSSACMLLHHTTSHILCLGLRNICPSLLLDVAACLPSLTTLHFACGDSYLHTIFFTSPLPHSPHLPHLLPPHAYLHSCSCHALDSSATLPITHHPCLSTLILTCFTLPFMPLLPAPTVAHTHYSTLGFPDTHPFHACLHAVYALSTVTCHLPLPHWTTTLLPSFCTHLIYPVTAYTLLPHYPALLTSASRLPRHLPCLYLPCLILPPPPPPVGLSRLLIPPHSQGPTHTCCWGWHLPYSACPYLIPATLLGLPHCLCSCLCHSLLLDLTSLYTWHCHFTASAASHLNLYTYSYLQDYLHSSYFAFSLLTWRMEDCSLPPPPTCLMGLPPILSPPLLRLPYSAWTCHCAPPLLLSHWTSPCANSYCEPLPLFCYQPS